MEQVDLVGWPAEETLHVTGSPSSLRVPIILENMSGMALGAGITPLVELKSASGETLPIRSVSALPGVATGSTAPARLRLKIDPQTPPGMYEGRIVVAGIARPLRIELVESIDLSVRPAPLIVDAALGSVQRAMVSIENSGNVALIVDLAGNYPLGEEAPLLDGDFGSDTSDGIGRLLALLPLGQRRNPPLREAGTILIAMPTPAVRIEPGNTATVPIDLTLPTALSPSARYRAYVPLYAKDLAILIVTVTKPKSPAARPPPRKKATTL